MSYLRISLTLNKKQLIISRSPSEHYNICIHIFHWNFLSGWNSSRSLLSRDAGFYSNATHFYVENWSKPKKLKVPNLGKRKICFLVGSSWTHGFFYDSKRNCHALCLVAEWPSVDKSFGYRTLFITFSYSYYEPGYFYFIVLDSLEISLKVPFMQLLHLSRYE